MSMRAVFCDNVTKLKKALITIRNKYPELAKKEKFFSIKSINLT